MSQTQYPDWITKTPAGFVNLREGYFSLPVFALSGHTWLGYTELVRQYNYNATTKFVVPTLPSKPSGVTFLLCIRWRVGEVVTRYKMWDDEGTALGLVGAPIYSGQVIPKNFVLEVFTILNETAPALATALTIASTIRTVPVDYRVRGSYEDDAAPTVVTDYQVQMPARGTGHLALFGADYFDSIFIQFSAPLTTPLTTWNDESGNAGNLDQLTNTPVVVGIADTSFKNRFKAQFAAASVNTGSAVDYYGGFIAINADGWTDGDYILSGLFPITMFNSGGDNDIKISGVAAGLNIPLNTDVLIAFRCRVTFGSPNATIYVDTYGDYEVSSSATGAHTTTPLASLELGDPTGSDNLQVAALSLLPGVTSWTITQVADDANFKAERDYLITKYIGWTTDLNFNADVAGEDNP